MQKIVTGKHTFWLTGKYIYVRAGNQNMLITNYDDSDLKPVQYAYLCDEIYRRKLSNSNSLYNIMGEYKLIYTSRRLS